MGKTTKTGETYTNIFGEIYIDINTRFQIYTMSMIDLQIQEGVQYQDMRKVHSLIIYTGNPIRNFEHLLHEVELIDGKYGKELYNGLIMMNFLQTKKMEEVSMELARSDFYQLMRLFEKEEQTSDVAREAVELYDRFISLEDYIYYKAIQRDRLWAKSKISEGRQQGLEQGLEQGIEQGIEQGLLQSLEEQILIKYAVKSPSWLTECTSEQLKIARKLILQDLSYEDFETKIKQYK